MKHIFLVRHAQSRGENELTEEGKGQAHALGQVLHKLSMAPDYGWPPLLVASSHLARAAETAMIVASYLKSPILLRRELAKEDWRFTEESKAEARQLLDKLYAAAELDDAEHLVVIAHGSTPLFLFSAVWDIQGQDKLLPRGLTHLEHAWGLHMDLEQGTSKVFHHDDPKT